MVDDVTPMKELAELDVHEEHGADDEPGQREAEHPRRRLSPPIREQALVQVHGSTRSPQTTMTNASPIEGPRMTGLSSGPARYGAPSRLRRSRLKAPIPTFAIAIPRARWRRRRYGKSTSSESANVSA